MFREGDVVRYAEAWCTENERHYRFVVLEEANPVGNIKIGCLNSNITFGHVEYVKAEMITLA